MRNLRAALMEIGLSERELLYLADRGNGKARAAALTSGKSRMTSVKADRFLTRLTGKTGWHDELHIQFGKWLVEGNRPVAAGAIAICSGCQTSDPDQCYLHPLESRCIACMKKHIDAFLEAAEVARLEKSARETRTAMAIIKADQEAGDDGIVSFPTLDILFTGAVETAGGWKNVMEAYAAALGGSTKERFQAAREIFAYVAKRDEANKPTLDISGAKNPEEARRMIADALISQWHRDKERPALRDLIPQYGGTIPPEDDDE